jgi:hypothetical protein
LILLAFVWPAALACRNEPAPVQVPVATARADARPMPPATLEPAEIQRRVEDLLQKTITKHASYLAMAANEGSQRAALDRYRAELTVRDVAGRIPDHPDVPELERQVQALLSSLPASPATVQAAARSPERRPLSPTLPDGTPIELKPDDIRGVVDLEIFLGGASPPLDELLEGIKTKLRRLVVPTRARRAEDGLHVHAEAYWFFGDVQVPRVAVKPADLGEALRHAGIPAGAAAAGPEVQAKLDRIAEQYRDMQARYADYARVVELVRQSVLFRERLAFFRNRVEALGAATAALLLTAAGRREDG